jgi:tetratricopeptide (TPR) repeat protein
MDPIARVSCSVFGLVASLALASAPAASPSLPEQLDRQHQQRDDPQMFEELLRRTAESLEGPSDSFDTLWRAARTHCAVSERATEKNRRMAEAETCWKLGDRAAAAAPGRAEGYYWGAVGVGLWAQSAGVLRAIREGVVGKLNERLDRAIAIDPAVNHGAAMLIKGRFLQEAPWPFRDLKRAGELYRRALERNPENLRARLFYADGLSERGERATAREHLERILRSDIGYDPRDGRAAQREAIQRLPALVR